MIASATRSRRSSLRLRSPLFFEQLESRIALASVFGDESAESLLAIAEPSHSVVASVAVTDDPGVQQMPSVAVNPRDPQHVVIAYMDYSLRDTGYAGIGVAISRDGGQSFERTSIPIPEDFDQGAADPVAKFDGQGVVFVSMMATTFLSERPSITDPDSGEPRAMGFQSHNGIFVARSEDGGSTWQSTTVVSHRFDGVHEVPFETMPSLAVDTFAALPDGQPNPHFGNLYVTWSRYYPPGLFPGEPNSRGGSDAMVAVSTDGGASWQIRTREDSETGAAVTILQDQYNNGIDPPPGVGYNGRARPSVGPEGDVYVSEFCGAWFPVNHSTDAGATFFVPTQDDEIGMPLGLGPKQIGGLAANDFRTLPLRAIAADPFRPGHVYVAEVVDQVNGLGEPVDEADVVFARSTDYGRTWEQGVMLAGASADVVNDDNGGQAGIGAADEVHASQIMVKLDVDRQGNIVLVWLDTRRDPSNRLFEVFGAVSTDGGQTFSPNFRISDRPFDADLGRFVDATGAENDFLGDSIGLAVDEGEAYVAWTDTRAGNQDVYFQRISVAPPPEAFNDRLEPNNSAAAATVVGALVERDLPRLAISEGDEDWIRVQSIATGELTASIFSENAERFRLELLDADGAPLAVVDEPIHGEQGEVEGRRIRAAAVSDAEFLLRIRTEGGEGAAAYSLHLQSLTANLGTTVHRVVEGSVSAEGQAYYLLRAAAAGAIEAHFDLTSGEDNSADLELLDARTLAVLTTGSEGDSVTTAVVKDQPLLIRIASREQSQVTFRVSVSNLDQFHAPQQDLLRFPAGLGPSQEAVADFDGDGRPDVAVANAGSNTVSILLGAGDGTFLAARQFAVGAFRTPNPVGAQSRLNTFRRDILADDFNGDAIPDLAVTNFDSSDVSILLGRGDGTFRPHRRFDATQLPIGLTSGDVNGDGNVDLVVVDSSPELRPGNLAVLLGRGDGNFQAQRLQVLPTQGDLSVLALADLNGDGSLQLIVGGSINDGINVFTWDGEGFQFFGHFDGSRQATDLIVADVNGDGHLDILATAISAENFVYLLPGNGDGTFGDPEGYFAGLGPIAIELIDWGSEVTSDEGETSLGPPDGRLDLVVANSGAYIGAVLAATPPEVIVLPGTADENGDFGGFGRPQRLALATQPLDLAVEDFDQDGSLDLGVVDRTDFFVLYGQPPAIAANNSPANARELGDVVHLVQPTLTIVPDHPEAWYRITAPTEAVNGAGDQVLDLSAGFAHQEGTGLKMEVLDARGLIRAQGERVRVSAHQGESLFVRIFGAPDAGGTIGSGAYTLAIAALPQVVAVEAVSLLPGEGNAPGGPTASLTLIFQGDRLQAETAQKAEHYRIMCLGPDGVEGTPDDQVIPVGAGLHPEQAAVYGPSSNVEISSGRSLPTAVRQTVTLLFGEALPPGSCRIEVSPEVQAAAFNEDELDLLTPLADFHGHPVVSRFGDTVQEGTQLLARDLVAASSTLGDLEVFADGTRFLSQFHGDLGAILDAQLTALGDDPKITARLLDQIIARFQPGLGDPNERPIELLVIFLDPVSIGLVDPEGNALNYDLQANTVVNQVPRAYVEVGSNVEVMVLANPLGTYQLSVANVPATARGGYVFFGRGGMDRVLLTEAMRAGERNFTLNFASRPRNLGSSSNSNAQPLLVLFPRSNQGEVAVARPASALPVGGPSLLGIATVQGQNVPATGQGRREIGLTSSTGSTDAERDARRRIFSHWFLEALRNRVRERVQATMRLGEAVRRRLGSLQVAPWALELWSALEEAVQNAESDRPQPSRQPAPRLRQMVEPRQSQPATPEPAARAGEGSPTRIQDATPSEHPPAATRQAQADPPPTTVPSAEE